LAGRENGNRQSKQPQKHHSHAADHQPIQLAARSAYSMNLRL
jgi:hypothetical protein